MAFRNSALLLAEAEDCSDDAAWAERGAYWQADADPPKGLPSLWSRPERKPLVLTGHGVRLRINHGALEVRHGFTHYPQKARTQLFFPGDVRMPSRIVLIEVDGAITFDVMEFLSHQDVPLVVLDWRGRVITTFGGKPAHADLTLREAQIAAQSSGTGLRIATELIRQKLVGSVETLRSLPRTSRVESGIERLGSLLSVLREESPPDVRSLLILEANGAAAYFASWLDVPVRWKGIGRRPIPPEWQRMPLRSSLLGDRNRNATHPFMAALNYSFGVLESQVRTALAQASLDPTIAYLHASRPSRSALVFDAMEPLRPLIERRILQFVQSHTFSPGDVFLTDRGVCRLHPQLTRAVAGRSLDDQAVTGSIEHLRSAVAEASVSPSEDR
jgi:CRISPR-associated endonuclease Cas1